MATTALYRRLRPESFAEVIGQDHVTEPLRRALRANRVGHAYLFSGPRGCGKTTSARILARCLNCAEGPTDTPCGTCDSCRDLARDGAGSLDVVEIDAASHGGVDDARELRERASFAPVRDRFKVFIIDEAHMVTSAGFNALLKLVEEPPEHVKFIFATTEPDKVIGTIRSRTHHYPFRLIPPQVLLPYLEEICRQENVPVGEGVLSLVIRAGGGSARDTLSVLDQLMAGSDERGLDVELAAALLGFTDIELMNRATLAIAETDANALFTAIDEVIGSGHEPRGFVEDLLARFRDLIVLTAAPDHAAELLPDVPVDQLEALMEQAQRFQPRELTDCAEIVSAALDAMSGATAPRLHLELLAAKLMLRGQAAPQAGHAQGPTGAAAGGSAAGRAGGAGAAGGSQGPTGAGSGGSARERAMQVARAQAEASRNRRAQAEQQMPGGAPPQAPARSALPAQSAAPAPSAPSAAPAQSAAPAPAADADDWGPVAQPGGGGAQAISPSSGQSAPAQQNGQGGGQQAASTGANGQRPAEQSTSQPSARQASAVQPSAVQASAVQPSAAQQSAQQPSAAQPPAEGGSAPGGAERIEQHWSAIMDQLQSIRRPSWALIAQNGTVHSFDGTQLVLAFRSTGLVAAFYRGTAQQNMAEAVKKITHLDVTVEATAGGEMPPSGSAGRPAAGGPAASDPSGGPAAGGPQGQGGPNQGGMHRGGQQAGRGPQGQGGGPTGAAGTGPGSQNASSSGGAQSASPQAGDDGGWGDVVVNRPPSEAAPPQQASVPAKAAEPAPVQSAAPSATSAAPAQWGDAAGDASPSPRAADHESVAPTANASAQSTPAPSAPPAPQGSAGEDSFIDEEPPFDPYHDDFPADDGYAAPSERGASAAAQQNAAQAPASRGADERPAPAKPAAIDPVSLPPQPGEDEPRTHGQGELVAAMREAYGADFAPSATLVIGSDDAGAQADADAQDAPPAGPASPAADPGPAPFGDTSAGTGAASPEPASWGDAVVAQPPAAEPPSAPGSTSGPSSAPAATQVGPAAGQQGRPLSGADLARAAARQNLANARGRGPGIADAGNPSVSSAAAPIDDDPFGGASRDDADATGPSTSRRPGRDIVEQILGGEVLEVIDETKNTDAY
ncbi:DNA polymerase III subunit gamma and tau [Helcobacillus sp. ACRRO]|uniref:DNA polymerase III subunit gamma and tau n=1 Tax=Helcobacillus sp. ACRRO TaxID=2918202 RepID=UPI001EF53E74|nr:DNA polymerase III subunit gamma and tau [Helcobacillus sp. ACRRO]